MWHIGAKPLCQFFKVGLEEARNIVRDCVRCAQFPSPNAHVQVKERPHIFGNGPNEIVSLDVLHLKAAQQGYRYLLVAIDSFTRFVRVKPLKRLDSKYIFERFLEMFVETGLPKVVKLDGAPYFMSAEMKGYLSSRNCLIKTISVGRSNANKVERINRVIRDFLNRRGLDWCTPTSIYDLSLYLNIFTNINHSKMYGDLTPFELRNMYLPDFKRFTNSRRPNLEYPPRQSKVRFYKLADELRQPAPRPVKLNPKDYYVGREVFYRRGGRKDGQLLRAHLYTLGRETATLETTNGQLVTRNYADIVLGVRPRW